MTKTAESGDVQSLSEFGLAFAVNNAFTNSAKETASASSSTTITASGAASHATNDAQGAMIVANTAADHSGTVLLGNVQSNTSGTSPVYTVDRWYTITGAVSASTPSTSGPFYVLPVMMPFWNVALSDSVSSVAGTETGAAMGGSELTSNGLARQKVTSVGRTAGSTVTYVVTMATTFTYSGSGSQNIGRTMLTNSLVASKKFGYFYNQINSGTPANVSSNGDTFTPTYSITVG